jgi:hypothetical protein
MMIFLHRDAENAVSNSATGVKAGKEVATAAAAAAATAFTLPSAKSAKESDTAA